MPEKSQVINDIQGILDRILDLNGQAYLIIDEKGQILHANHPALALFGAPEQALISSTIDDIILNPSMLEFVKEHVDELQGGDQVTGNFLVKHADEVNLWIRIRTTSLPDTTKTLYGLIWEYPGIATQQVREVNTILKHIDEAFEDGDGYIARLPGIAKLLVPRVADWCGIHVVESDGSIRRVVIEPQDVVNSQTAYDWIENDLPNDEADGLPGAIRQNKSILVAEVSPLRRAASAGVKSYMIVPLSTHQQTFGAISLMAVEAERRFDRNSLLLAENIAIHVASHLEKSQIHHESVKLSAELEQRAGEGTAELNEVVSQLKQSDEMIQTLFRVSNKLNATLDVEQILDTLAQEAIQIVNGESGFAGLRTEEGMAVHKYFQQGVSVPFEHTWAPGEGIPGWVLKYKVPYGTSDAANDPLIRHELAVNEGVRSIICTPILDSVGEVIGYFDIRNKQGAEGFTINDQEMLLTLAPVASIAIQNALAYQQRMATVNELKESAAQLQELAASLESAREEERTQIARELHDELGQALTAVKFDLAWLGDELEKKDENLFQKIKDITARVNTLIQRVKRISTELRPGMLEDLGLVASIEWQAQDFEKHTGVRCKVNLPGEELVLTREQSLAIFRIFQEALTNVVRYAEAEQVDITLSKAGEVLVLEVKDNGKGIKAEEVTGLHSLGLLGMRERATYLGGTFDVHGTPGEGTMLRVTIPVNKTEEADQSGI